MVHLFTGPPQAATVADAMLRAPRTCPPTTTVAEARAFFANGHVHALLVVADGVLVAVVDRADLAAEVPGRAPVRRLGRTGDRSVAPSADLGHVRRGMRDGGRRRLAVVDDSGVLLGLLCLKRDGRGFCSDAGVTARARERSRGRVLTG